MRTFRSHESPLMLHYQSTHHKLHPFDRESKYRVCMCVTERKEGNKFSTGFVVRKSQRYPYLLPFISWMNIWFFHWEWLFQICHCLPDSTKSGFMMNLICCRDCSHYVRINKEIDISRIHNMMWEKEEIFMLQRVIASELFELFLSLTLNLLIFLLSSTKMS